MRQLLMIGLVMLGLGLGQVVLAAEFRFVAPQNEFRPGDEFLVQFTVDTEQPANAVSGVLVFPPELLTVQQVQDGNSVVNFWIERPVASQSGEISFAGMTPGGILGTNEILFSVLFRATDEGAGEVAATDLQLLLNDGKATPISTSLTPFAFSISNDVPLTGTSSPVAEDQEPPEDFVIEFASDPNLFEGRRFVVFATQDKGSGVSHYEVKEGLWGKFVTAESPYVLKNQGEQRVAVKAVDNAGNERLVVTGDEGDALAYHRRALMGAVIVMCSVAVLFIALLAVGKKLRR